MNKRSPQVTQALPSVFDQLEYRMARTMRFIINVWVVALLIALFALAVKSGLL